MASYMIRGLPDGLVARAKAAARDRGEAFDDALRLWMASYADGQSAAAQFGARGGAARAANMTRKERSEAARAAVTARWKRVKSEDASHG